MPGPALGQTVCGEREMFVKHLGEKYQEAPVARALSGTQGKAVFEVFASPDGATFTALLTWPNGRSCVVASGKEWEAFEVVVATGPET